MTKILTESYNSSHVDTTSNNQASEKAFVYNKFKCPKSTLNNFLISCAIINSLKVKPLY